MSEKRYCKLRKKDVYIERRNLTETGNPNPTGEEIECLNKDAICEELDCEYAPAGIGCGENHPF